MAVPDKARESESIAANSIKGARSPKAIRFWAKVLAVCELYDSIVSATAQGAVGENALPSALQRASGLAEQGRSGLRKQWRSSFCVLTYALIAANAAARAQEKEPRWEVDRSSSAGQLSFIAVLVQSQPLVRRGRCD